MGVIKMTLKAKRQYLLKYMKHVHHLSNVEVRNKFNSYKYLIEC